MRILTGKRFATVLLGLMVACGCSNPAPENTGPEDPPPEPPPLPPPGLTAGATMSTYWGGGLYDTVRDVAVDAAGNVYITGGTESTDFPVSAGAFQTTINPGVGSGDGQALPQDVFVTKLSPDGTTVWSTLIGGPNYDRAYAVEVDAQGFVYVAGRAGDGFPVTSGVFQTSFVGGGAGGLYGSQDGFVCKIEPDGNELVFCSYFGAGDSQMVRDLDVDESGDVYIAAVAGAPGFPDSWFTGAFQPDRVGGTNDAVIARISSDGSRVVWASYLGGSGNDGGGPSIRVDPQGNVLTLISTSSIDMPTPGGFDGSLGGSSDLFLAKLSSDGRSLLFGTYLGGSKGESAETHHLAVDPSGHAYVASGTTSSDFPTTQGAYQTVYAGSGGSNTGQYSNYQGDGFVVKVSPSGQLIHATLVGGRFGDGIEGVDVDSEGNVYFTGGTFSPDFPVTEGETYGSGGRSDAFAVKLSADFSRLLYSAKLGGSEPDVGRSGYVDPSGTFFFGGETSSVDWPTISATQEGAGGGNADGLLVRVEMTQP